MQKMPYGSFKLIKETSNFTHDFIMKYNIENEEKGYLLCVDVDYPQNLHDLHKDYPFFCEKINDFLCLSVNNKRNYLTHINNLQQALSHGLILVNVHYAIEYLHGYWMRNYINFNTEKRGKTTNEDERDFYKKMNNCVYGKSIENPTKRCKFNVFSIKEQKRINKAIADPNYLNSQQISENVLIINNNKNKLMDKPIYIGFVVLEFSKYRMYDIFYNCFKKMWKDGLLMYTDTDSFIYKIPRSLQQVATDCLEFPNYFNKSLIGAMKDEYPNDEIVKFVALKSKLYYIELSSGKIAIKSKGITSRVPITWDEFMLCLRENIGKYSIQTRICSMKHALYTKSSYKISLPFTRDEKRLPHPDNINLTLPLGYKFFR